MSIYSNWIRGLAQGLAYGLAVTGFESWFMAMRLVRMNLPAFTRMPTEAAATVLVFTVLLGLVVTPLLRLRWGGLVHLVAVAAIWSVIGNTTNLAARLQGLTRELGASIAIDAKTRSAAGAVCRGFLMHADVRIRGRTDPLDLFALPLPDADAQKIRLAAVS